MVSGKKYMVKTINVLVDLPDFGIVDLPLAYTLHADEKRPDLFRANCEVLLSAENLPEWLFTNTFSITYIKTTNENVNMVSVCTEKGTTNRYHEMMLSIVSSYIKLKEDNMDLKKIN